MKSPSAREMLEEALTTCIAPNSERLLTSCSILAVSPSEKPGSCPTYSVEYGTFKENGVVNIPASVLTGRRGLTPSAHKRDSKIILMHVLGRNHPVLAPERIPLDMEVRSKLLDIAESASGDAAALVRAISKNPDLPESWREEGCRLLAEARYVAMSVDPIDAKTQWAHNARRRLSHVLSDALRILSYEDIRAVLDEAVVTEVLSK